MFSIQSGSSRKLEFKELSVFDITWHATYTN
jgi:hypothetical protein